LEESLDDASSIAHRIPLFAGRAGNSEYPLGPGEAVPPLSGVIGKVQSVTDSSIDVQTGSGVARVDITRPLTTYKQIPSDLSHVTSTSYVGVASTEQADGKEVAKQIIIFQRNCVELQKVAF
jgi:hypothetical protein